MPRILENKYYVDEIYDATLIHPIEGVSREGLWKIFDMGVIDGILHSIGESVTEAGRLARYLQAGFVRGYAAIILAWRADFDWTVCCTVGSLRPLRHRVYAMQYLLTILILLPVAGALALVAL